MPFRTGGCSVRLALTLWAILALQRNRGGQSPGRLTIDYLPTIRKIQEYIAMAFEVVYTLSRT